MPPPPGKVVAAACSTTVVHNIPPLAVALRFPISASPAASDAGTFTDVPPPVVAAEPTVVAAPPLGVIFGVNVTELVVATFSPPVEFADIALFSRIADVPAGTVYTVLSPDVGARSRGEYTGLVASNSAIRAISA